MEKHLYDMLAEYVREDVLPMHMPGHKRNALFSMPNPYEWDITEIRDFDNLHHPEGVLRDLMLQMSRSYGSDQTYLLVNGSTCGILAALTACCRRGNRIAVARNCHKSVYNAIRLLELRPAYLYPDGAGGDMERLGIAGSITPECVEEVLCQYEDIACVMITSPTYEGIVSPVSEIADVAHRHGIPLVVDEAHGAHFNWHPAFPDTALKQGADLVIESLHKTLPAFTQTGVLHAQFERVEQKKLEWALQTYQSSSPSYLLMASADHCYRFLLEKGRLAYEEYWGRLSAFREKMQALTCLELFDSPQKECSKIVIVTERAGVSGREFAELLYRRYRIELEMSCGNYCIAMTSVCDEAAAFDRLADALLALDYILGDAPMQTLCYAWQQPERVRYSYEVAEFESEECDLAEAAGRIVASDISLYPPGVPVVVAGERISQNVVATLLAGWKAGYEVIGMTEGKICVLMEDEPPERAKENEYG